MPRDDDIDVWRRRINGEDGTLLSFEELMFDARGAQEAQRTGSSVEHQMTVLLKIQTKRITATLRPLDRDKAEK